MSDIAKLRNEIEVITSTLSPSIDLIKYKIRLEEITDKYTIKLKSDDELSKDLIGNIKLYISSKRIEGLSDMTLKDYYSELMLFEYYVQKPTVNITTSDIRGYLASNNDVMTSTNSKKLSILKTFFTWLVDEEIILRNPTARIKAMKLPKRLPKALTALELEQLREACETLRERALVEVLYSTGCRLSEASNIKRKDIDWANGSIHVIGKGDKERIVYLNSKAIYHLERYLEECEENENDCDYVFSTIIRPYRQMQGRTIQDLVNKISSRANIDKNITPHVFRHTMATLAMDNGIQLGDLQQLLGHSSSNTTLKYATVSENRKQQAHRKYVQ